MRSMTGFGRGEHADARTSYHVELSSVNRKQADVSISIPRSHAALEPEVRRAALARISRGRISVAIAILPLTKERQASVLRIDHALARRYLHELRKLASPEKDIRLDISAGDLLRAPGIFELEEQPVELEAAWKSIRTALDQAMDRLISMRTTEGAHLRDDLEDRIACLERETRAISDLAPQVTDHHRSQLARRLAEAGLPLPLDDERLVREIGLFAERSDITEELTRLGSHITKFRELMGSDEPAGRSLDFLAQELFRELNTIGSKANNATIAQHVVNGKTEVEKIREQVQNVE